MTTLGLRGTGDWGVDERPKSFNEMILRSAPNGDAPLMALISKAKKKSLTDPEHAWWEQTNRAIEVAINNGAGYAAGATVLAVDSAINFTAQDLVPGDVLRHVAATELAVPADEVLIVTGNPSATTITVSRGQLGTAAVAFTDNDVLEKIGNVHAEGSLSPEATTTNPVKENNFLQIFKTAYKITNTALETHARTGELRKEKKFDRMIEHSHALEKAFLYGTKFEAVDAGNGQPIRYTQGLRSFIKTNVSIFGAGANTEDELLDALSPIFDFSTTGAGNKRLILCGNGFLNNLNKVIRNSPSTRLVNNGTLSLWGMELHRISIPQGELLIRTHPLLNTSLSARNHNSAFVIEPSNLEYLHLRNRDTKFEKNIQPPNADYEENQWISEVGLAIHHEQTFGYLGNFTAA